MQTFGASVLMPTTDCRTPAPPVALIAGVLVALPVALTLVLPDWYFSSPGGIDMPNFPKPPLIFSRSARVTPLYDRLSISIEFNTSGGGESPKW